MNEFLKFYNEVKKPDWTLEIYHSRYADWSISIGYLPESPNHGDTILSLQNCDLSYALAKAEVLLKDFLKEHEGGY
ncbi:hypothetical protein DNH61_11705 [Paenibacillus sambharensis]|uniref:Uncharacterized protein n=1 Tax=Paenibacillus sambharensis TaxID=1803190 RepID=A0A2W1L544_9BACL|nr:hypothetical protein [Paenibacillus sambharensis]PZD95218.1 hypothetical protein DNH61_11705 [Paenibacillus sambharensis]